MQVQAITGSTWIRVTDASGKDVFQGVMDTGDVKDFSDPKLLKIRFGNSSAVTVLVNGVNKGTPTCGAVVCAETYKLADGSA